MTTGRTQLGVRMYRGAMCSFWRTKLRMISNAEEYIPSSFPILPLPCLAFVLVGESGCDEDLLLLSNPSRKLKVPAETGPRERRRQNGSV